MSLNTQTPNETNILAQYKLCKIIGEGTFGKVHLAIHIPTGQKVAVKVLQKEKIVDQSDIERVTREICILKVLRHPNIAQLYEIIETKSSIHLIMEFAPGGELFDYIVKRRRLPEKEAVKFMQQLMAGVEYIHKNGIVHRDLKPENLLLDEKGNIKIVDFGLSNQYSSGEKLTTACGSPCYAAPEMIAGKQYECLGVDIWSCGIILFAMLCGYLPFEDENTNRLYKKILSGELSLPKHLSEESKSILKSILNVNPETRFKIEQIRQTKWYNQIETKYTANGIIIGRDAIDINEAIAGRIESLGYETHLLKDYLINNKHNYLTSFYYLLKKKSEREDLTKDKAEKINRDRNGSFQSDSKRQPHVISKINPNSDRKRDESLNANKIISSLVHANRGALTSPRWSQNSNNRPVLFKAFPKERKDSFTGPQEINRKSFDNSSPKNRLRSQSKDSSFNSIRMAPSGFSSSRASSSNPRREEMVNILRQIPNKISNEINQTNQKPSFPMPQTPKTNFPSSSMRFRTEAPSTPREPRSRSKQIPFDSFRKIATQSTAKKIHPFIHIGPFNSNCLFMDNPGNLFLKVITYLRRSNISCKQNDHFTLSLPDNQQISIESFQGVGGYFLVNFNPYTPLSDKIIAFLNA